MRKYEELEMEVVEFDVEDVIATSGGGNQNVVTFDTPCNVITFDNPCVNEDPYIITFNNGCQ